MHLDPQRFSYNPASYAQFECPAIYHFNHLGMPLVKDGIT